jgi:hypothetical protein
VCAAAGVVVSPFGSGMLLTSQTENKNKTANMNMGM